MPTYNVTWTETVLWGATVEATNENEVRDLFIDGRIDAPKWLDSIDEANLNIEEA